MAVKAPENVLSTSFPGRAEPVREVNLAFEVSGTLEQLPIKVGDQLKQGQLLAQLNQKSFTARLDATQARYRKAVNDERRVYKLLQAGNASQTQYDSVQTNLDVLASQLVLDKKALTDTTLRAPFNGQVAAVYLDNYTFVAASTQVARVIDISQIEMWVDLPEQFAVLANRDLDYSVHVVFDAFPDKRIKARVKEWGREASPENRTFPVGIIMDQPDDIAVLPGMSGVAFAEVPIEQLNLESYVEVPASAVFTLPSQKTSSVWVITDGKVQQREVVVHKVNRNVVSIKHGLQQGEQIVVAGVHSLGEGQAVRVLNKDAGL